MQLQKQVCSVEQSKRFKELGVDINSIFLFVNNWRNPRHQPVDDGEFIILAEEERIIKTKAQARGADVEFTSAFTVAELGQMLPDKFNSQGYKLGDNKDMHWFCRNERVDTFPFQEGIQDSPAHMRNKEAIRDAYGETEAIARANMLILLLEKGYTTASEVNKRLQF